MKAKGILVIAVACFVVASVAAISWGQCTASVQLGPVNDCDLPVNTGEYGPCERWLVWDFEFWFWTAPDWTVINTYTLPTDFYREYDSRETRLGYNHFEGYVWDDHQSHETGIGIAIGSTCGHFSDIELYVQYSASQPDR